jgi:hypothetical protein
MRSPAYNSKVKVVPELSWSKCSKERKWGYSRDRFLTGQATAPLRTAQSLVDWQCLAINWGSLQRVAQVESLLTVEVERDPIPGLEAELPAHPGR